MVAFLVTVSYPKNNHFLSKNDYWSPGVNFQVGSGVSFKKKINYVLRQAMKIKREYQLQKSKRELSLEISAALANFEGKVKKVPPAKALYAKTEGNSCAAAFGSSLAGRASADSNSFNDWKLKKELKKKRRGKNFKRRRA